VRIRARDDRLSAGVQKVAVYGDQGIDAQSLFVEPRPSYGNGNAGYRRGNGSGNGKRERGSGDGEDDGGRKVDELSSSAGGTPIAAPVADEGSGAQDPPVAAAVALRITLEETDDADEDHERLRALVNVLRDYNGEGMVRLAIRQRDGEEVEMELPSARYCPELTQLLGQIIGPWGTVRA
jgi:hypothetical protein